MNPAAVASLVAAHVDALAVDHPVRVVIDGPPWSGLRLAPLVEAELLAMSRPVLVVDVVDYLRPASLRLERGRDDPDAFYEDWVDLASLRREVFDPTGPGGSLRVLPARWDAEADRATRADYVEVTPTTVIVVAGWFLLGAGLDLELAVHVALSAEAMRRRVSREAADRELPAYARYDAEVQPTEIADIVVRADDPRRPAVIDRTS